MKKLGLLVRLEAKAGQEKTLKILLQEHYRLLLKKPVPLRGMHSVLMLLPSVFTILFQTKKAERHTLAVRSQKH